MLHKTSKGSQERPKGLTRSPMSRRSSRSSRSTARAAAAPYPPREIRTELRNLRVALAAAEAREAKLAGQVITLREIAIRQCQHSHQVQARADATLAAVQEHLEAVAAIPVPPRDPLPALPRRSIEDVYNEIQREDFEARRALDQKGEANIPPPAAPSSVVDSDPEERHYEPTSPIRATLDVVPETPPRQARRLESHNPSPGSPSFDSPAKEESVYEPTTPTHYPFRHPDFHPEDFCRKHNAHVRARNIYLAAHPEAVVITSPVAKPEPGLMDTDVAVSAEETKSLSHDDLFDPEQKALWAKASADLGLSECTIAYWQAQLWDFCCDEADCSPPVGFPWKFHEFAPLADLRIRSACSSYAVLNNFTLMSEKERVENTKCRRERFIRNVGLWSVKHMPRRMFNSYQAWLLTQPHH